MSDTPEITAPRKRTLLADVCTPVFTPEMGARFKLMRQHLLLDQHQMGERLGLSQTTISALETGKIVVPRYPFTVARLVEVFGERAADFIVLNAYASRFNAAEIQRTYFEVKFHTERRLPSGEKHWTHRALREGHPRRQRG